jgi:hypothetical protein
MIEKMYEIEQERSSWLGSVLARWRSYRQIHRILLIFSIVFTIFVLDRYRVELAGTFTIPEPPINETLTVDPFLDQREESMAQAGNSTLGFHAIYYINMKARYDREDAMALQSYISGVDLTDYPAVEADMIDPVGMPPTHRPMMLKVGEKGCWRAHANVRLSRWRTADC